MQTMSASLDLYILPIARQSGQDNTELPGVFPALPPRRPARGREADRLVLYMTLLGGSTTRPDQYTTILESLAETYYKTAGTATAAMRAVAEALNQSLLERNLRNATAGQQISGLLTQLVLRSDMVYLAHSGPVQSFVISNGPPQQFSDMVGSGRGLGASRQAAIRYYHCTLQPGQYLLPAHHTSPAWESETFLTSQNLDFEGLRRKLIAIPDQDLSALLIQVQTGSGKLNLMRLRQAGGMARPAANSGEAPKPPAPSPAGGQASSTPAAPGAAGNPTANSSTSPVLPPASQLIASQAERAAQPFFAPLPAPIPENSASKPSAPPPAYPPANTTANIPRYYGN